MGYRKCTQPPASGELVFQFEKAIDALVNRFRDHPYMFYTETDMHCYLYHRLYKGGLINGLYKTADGHDTILLHKEYPTSVKFKRQDDGTLTEAAQGRRRGAFDITVWDPEYIGKYEHRAQKVLCAAELALNQCQPGNPHTLNDATKLAGPSSEVKYGYLLFFVRDDDKAYLNNKDQIWDQLRDASQRVRVVFARVTTGMPKEKPIKLGDWGKV